MARGRSRHPTHGSHPVSGHGWVSAWPPSCPSVPAALHNVSYCVAARWQPRKRRTWGCLPACGRAVSGACQAVPGRSARAVSRSQGDWRWGRSRWQGCPKGRHPCMKLTDPFLVSLVCLSAQAVLEVKPVGYGMSVVSPVSPMTDCPPSLSSQIAWGLPSSTHQSKQTWLEISR